MAGLRIPALQSRGGDGSRYVRKFREKRSVFPCTKSAMIVWGNSPAVGYREPRKFRSVKIILSIRQEIHAGTAVRGHLHREPRLKNLFQ